MVHHAVALNIGADGSPIDTVPANTLDIVGPVQVNYPGDADVEEQASTVVFTNTFADPIPAAQIVAQPAFTG